LESGELLKEGQKFNPGGFRARETLGCDVVRRTQTEATEMRAWVLDRWGGTQGRAGPYVSQDSRRNIALCKREH